MWLTSNPTVVAQSPIYTDWLLADYRLQVRDEYVQELDEKGEFYGLVTDVGLNSGQALVEIDHGGAVKSFVAPKEEAEKIKPGDLLWIKYDTIEGNKVVVETKIAG